MHDLIVIPARFASKRLPGKPLMTIAGRTLLERVLHVARRAAGDMHGVDIVVATDDQRIFDHAQALGADVVMTASEISSGTGRALAAADAMPFQPEIVVNLQGDAPFVPSDAIIRLLEAARRHDADVTTPVVPVGWDELDALRDHKRDTPFSGTTCTRAQDGRALWFSKAIIPAIRDEQSLRQSMPLSPVLRHLGLYAYRLDALRRFEAAPASFYEKLEGLEQLRFLELDMHIQTIEIERPRRAMSGIDTIEDIALAERVIAQDGDPLAAS